jgi:hypothetical protein
VNHIPRESWAILLVFLHLFVAPCATAMVLMPADADCEHCQTMDSPDACVVASATAGSVLTGLAVDTGPFDPRGPLLLSRARPVAVPEWLTTGSWSRAFATRHSSDPPLYLRLGQLRL